jgi:hypothetical protein
MPSLTVWQYPTPLGVDAGELNSSGSRSRAH